MQPYFENSLSKVSSQSLYLTQTETFLGKERLTQIEASVDEDLDLYDSNDQKSLGEITKGLLPKGLPEKRRLQKPSTALWSFILMLGDGVLLVTLLMFVLIPSLHLKVQVSSYAFGLLNRKFVWICLGLVLWSVSVKITRAQDLSYVSSRLQSPLLVVYTLLLMLIFWLTIAYFLIDNGVFFSNWAILFLMLVVLAFFTWRVILAEIISLPAFRRQAIILGINTAGETIAEELRRAKHPNVNVLGYIGESIVERSHQDGLPILGGGSALRSLAHSGIIDMIIVALDYKANSELLNEAIEASQLGISVLPMTVVYESTSGKIPVEHISDQWYIALQSERIISPLYLCWRKMLDLVCGFCGLLFLCLVLPILAMLIYLDSSGPVFYSQERLGLQGKSFSIYKFRSMCTNAESAGHAVWAEKYDPRITKIGRFMRATHLDELPQVLNILRGDMSVIGPRPERAEFVTELEKTVPFYSCRLAVKPGLTGWAQVKYSYGNTNLDALAKLQYDLYYVKHQSFMLDIYIILKTVIEVLLHRGA